MVKKLKKSKCISLTYLKIFTFFFTKKSKEISLMTAYLLNREQFLRKLSITFILTTSYKCLYKSYDLEFQN